MSQFYNCTFHNRISRKAVQRLVNRLTVHVRTPVSLGMYHRCNPHHEEQGRITPDAGPS